MKPILEINNISKRYVIRHSRQTYLSLRDSIATLFKPNHSVKEEFYALKDVTFNVERGETIGIIGKNGAGKSTLLKVLSKITLPSSGFVISRGRVASLLEVGTGFHLELTGRENIFLNGSILGMKRREIMTKFDEIVEFSGTGKFLDTPLKYYSSGMQLRLAFSVSAFLEPEIMIIDEVLAVGDSDFQKKCIGKMDDVSKSGRTILFVSHDLNAVQTLCKTIVLLQNGSIKMMGDSETVIANYLNSGGISTKWQLDKEVDTPHFTEIEVKLKGNQPDLKLIITFKVKCMPEMRTAFVAFDISNIRGIAIGQAIPLLEPFIKAGNEEKQYRVEIDIPNMVPDDYCIGAWLGPYYNETYHWQKECVQFSLTESPQKNRIYPHAAHAGFIVPNSRLLSS